MPENKMQSGQSVINEMFSVGAHFGYSRARRHASVRQYLYGTKNGADIIDLSATQKMLERATERMKELGKQGKVVLFVGTKHEVRDIVEPTALALSMPYITERWLGGIFTNWTEIKKRVARLKELTEKFTKGELGKYTKKEKLLFEREKEKLEKGFGGIASLEGMPAAVVIVDPRREKIAVEEANKMKIETIAILNSDCNADEITYPILANDSAIESVKYFMSALRSAYEAGVKLRA